ncbi:glycosyltransferase family 2 protein [Patescibacteria group bacterium]|nr:glycosyltransferase family 2 protein [Patescibacteria group bacterium]
MYKEKIFSIIILCYKEEYFIIEFVKKVLRALKDNNIDNYEIVLVGNYDDKDDKTPQVVKNLAEKNQKIVCVAKKKQGMMGWDMRSGFDLAKGDYVAVIDGDGQMPIKDLIRIFNIIKDGKFDLVKTYRISREDGWKRKNLSYMYNFIFKLLFPRFNIKDVNSKPKIITKKAYKRLNLKSDDWFIDAEIMIQARRLKFKIKEIPAHFKKSEGKRDSFIKFFTIFEFIKNLIIYRLKEFKK